MCTYVSLNRQPFVMRSHCSFGASKGFFVLYQSRVTENFEEVHATHEQLLLTNDIAI